MRYARLWSMAALGLVVAGPVFCSEVARAREIAKSSAKLETTLAKPKAYGTQDYTVTTIPAIAFFPDEEGPFYFTSLSLGRRGPNFNVVNFYAPINLPAGVIIDYIGLNSANDAPGALGVAVYRRTPGGTLLPVGTFSSTLHGSWLTDYNAVPLEYLVSDPSVATIVHVQQGAFPTPQFFGHVEVWWRRFVSNAPATPTFNDVPTDHPFYQFIEALVDSGITAGCGNGSFCPENPLTRGQMAVFLAKALGLHWGATR